MKIKEFIYTKSKDKRGSASIFACISILLSLVLVFSGVQLYRINTVSASVQETADACAMASQNVVANFKETVKSCDAAIYTMNLTQASLYGLSVVAACTGQIPISAELISSANNLGSIRSKVSKTAKKSLNTYQKALPAISAAKSLTIATSNQNSNSNFLGSAILVPAKGDDIDISEGNLDEIGKGIDEKTPDLQDAGEKLAKLEEELNAIKEEAFRLDCGDAKCMQERADSLINIPATLNPKYSSVDVWDFNVALSRAHAYYMLRAKQEIPSSFSDTREQARSYLRVDFYNYSSSKIREVIGHGKNENGLYYWPDIYKEKNGFKDSDRYTENIYPITNVDGKKVMHSNINLPCASGATSRGSASLWDSADFEMCPTCEFTSNNVGNIPSASTNINSGFEYYFHRIEDLYWKYVEKGKELKETQGLVKSKANSIFDDITSLLSEAKRCRITCNPPGSSGSIAVVVDDGDVSKNIAGSAFVAQNNKLDTRLAVSGAKLLKDENDSLAAPVFDAITGGSTNSYKAEKIAWDKMAGSAVGDKNSKNDIKSLCNESMDSGRLLSSTVGKWVSDAFSGVLDATGLTPADMSVEKPILMDTLAVANNTPDSFAKTYSEIASNIRDTSASTTDGITGLIDECESMISEILKSTKITIFKEKIPVIGEIGFDIDIGQLAGDEIDSMLDDFSSKLREVYQDTTNIKVWE